MHNIFCQEHDSNWWGRNKNNWSTYQKVSFHFFHHMWQGDRWKQPENRLNINISVSILWDWTVFPWWSKNEQNKISCFWIIFESERIPIIWGCKSPFLVGWLWGGAYATTMPKMVSERNAGGTPKNRGAEGRSTCKAWSKGTPWDWAKQGLFWKTRLQERCQRWGSKICLKEYQI